LQHSRAAGDTYALLSAEIVHFLRDIEMICRQTQRARHSVIPRVDRGHFSGLAALALLFMLTLAPFVHAARITQLNGKLSIQRGNKTLNAAVGTRLRQGDAIISNANAEALVRFDDGARLAMRPESHVEVHALKQTGAPTARQKTIKVVKGGLRYVSGQGTAKNNVSFITNTATIGIRGTDIEIAVSQDAVNTDPAGTYLKVNSGQATLAAVDGTQVDVDPGQIAYGGLPELVPRGASGVRRPAARKVVESVGGLFKPGKLDRLMK
jgi:hypothetical protein